MNKKKTKKIYKHHEYWSTITPKQDKNILKYNHGKKYMKTLFVIYAYIESLLEKNTFIL